MVSINFINECKNRANANRLGKIIVENKEITNKDNLQSFSIDSSCYSDGNIIGTVYVKKLTGNFVALPSDVNLLDKPIQAQFGVKYSDNSTEYINVGKYIVERPKDEQTVNMSQIVAYDCLINNIDKPYVCGIDYSIGNITLKDLYIDVCNQLELIPKTTEFLNNDIPIENNPFTNNDKNRLVLQTISKIASSFIDIDADTNQIDLRWLSQNIKPDCIFTRDQYSTLEGGKIKCGPINCLIIRNSQIESENVTIKDDESITIHGENQLVISEDYVLHNAETRQLAINAIWNRVKGLSYIDSKIVSYYGKPFLKLGDKVRVYTDDTNYFDTYVLKHNFTYDGTFASTIESPVLTKQEIKTKQDISLQDALKNTQIDVNKQNQTITSTIQQVNDLESDINNNYNTKQEMSNIIEQTLNHTENIIKETGGNNLLINSSFYQNADEWVKDNTLFKVITDNTEVEQNTTCKTELILNNGFLSQEFDNIIGNQYTLSFQYKKPINDTKKVIVRFYKNDIDFVEILNSSTQKQNREKVVYTYKATVSKLKLYIYSDNADFRISDLIVQNGTSTIWSQNAFESRGISHKLGDGQLVLSDIKSQEKSIQDANDIKFYNDSGQLNSKYGQSGFDTPSGNIKNEANICGLEYSNINSRYTFIN